jgi:TolB protein
MITTDLFRKVNFFRAMAMMVPAALAVGVLGLASIAEPARAAFPGGNGKIVFDSFRDGNEEIYVMNKDGSNQINLTNNPATDVETAFSPDGSKIAFRSNSTFLGTNFDVFVMSAGGSSPTRLTNNSANDARPDWQPLR